MQGNPEPASILVAPDTAVSCTGGHHQRDVVVLHLDPLRPGDHDRSVREPAAHHPPGLPAARLLR
jgi:hypothetical protein